MLLNCGVGEDSWESLGLQGDHLLARTERAFSPASDQHQAYQELIAIYASPEYTFEEGNNMLSFADDYLEERKLARLPNVEDY